MYTFIFSLWHLDSSKLTFLHVAAISYRAASMHSKTWANVRKCNSVCPSVSQNYISPSFAIPDIRPCCCSHSVQVTNAYLQSHLPIGTPSFKFMRILIHYSQWNSSLTWSSCCRVGCVTQFRQQNPLLSSRFGRRPNILLCTILKFVLLP